MRVRSVAALALLGLLVYAAGLVVFYSMSVRTDDEGRPALRGRQHFVTTTKAPLFVEEAAASDKAAREANAKAPKVLRKAFSTVLCDDGDALPAVVLLMSLLRSGTDAQLVPLLTPRVSKQPEEILRMMAPSRVKPRRFGTSAGRVLRRRRTAATPASARSGYLVLIVSFIWTRTVCRRAARYVI